jgi:hypothetical protein
LASHLKREALFSESFADISLILPKTTRVVSDFLTQKPYSEAYKLPSKMQICLVWWHMPTEEAEVGGLHSEESLNSETLSQNKKLKKDPRCGSRGRMPA